MWTALVPAGLLHASAALALVAPAAQQARPLNPPLPVEHLGDVQNAVIVPGGARVVYVEGSSGDLFSVPIDGGAAPIRLNSRVTGGNVDPLFRFDPQGTRVVYRAARVFRSRPSTQLEGVFDLVSAPVDGSADAVLLNLPDGGSAASDFQVTPSGTHVVHRLSGWLLSVPITGGNAVTLARGTVEGVSGFRILADSSGIVCREDRTQGVPQLFRIPLGGSPNPVLLSGPTGRVEPDFELIPDGRFVVYRTDVGLDGTLDLVAAPTSAPFTPRQLSAGVVPGGNVNSFIVNPDNVRVIYAGEQEHAGIHELYCARLDGAVPPVRLNPVLGPGGDVRDGFRIDGFSLHVVFRTSLRSDACTLNSTRIDGAREELVAPMKGRDSIADDFRISGDNSRVAFRADPDGDRVFDLYSVPIRNAAGLRLLARGVLDFELNHAYAFYRAEETPGVPELFAVPLDGSRAPVRVHPPLALGHATRAPYSVAADGRYALFVADPNVRGVFELFRVTGGRLRGPLQLSGDEVRLASRPGSVQDFVLAGGRALYRAAQELDDVVGLYSVPLDGSAAPRALSPASVTPSRVVTRALTADGARVAFVQDNEHARRELYAAPVDGSAPAVRLDAPTQPRCDVAPRFVLTPDGRNALYVADQELDETPELYRVALDGRSAPVRLHPPLREGRSVKATFQLTPDGTRVLFASDLGVADRFDLYVAPLDGSSAPRKLSLKTNGGGDVREIALTPDGASAVYLADQAVDGQFELWLVPLDGSAAPRRLNEVLLPEGDVSEFAVDPTGAWALYLADVQHDEQRGLYAVPLDGNAPARELLPRAYPDAYLDIGRFVVTPDGARVAFLAAGVGTVFFSPNTFVLYAAPLDGSAPARGLGSLDSYLTNWDLRLTPDGTRAVYRLQAPGSFYRDRQGLFSVPLDGSRRPVVLNTPGMLAEPFAIAADSSSVVYATRLIDELGYPIYRVPIDGPREASLGLVVGTESEPTQLEVGGQTLVWLQGDLYSF